MSILPTDDKARKNLPIFRMITGYFPKALREVTRVCVANNVRYNPDRAPADINWARGKSTDQLGSLFRHILEYQSGLIFEELPPEVQTACGEGFDKVYTLAEAAWRALAALELEIETQEAKRMPSGQYGNLPLRCLFTFDHSFEKGISNYALAPVKNCDCDNCKFARMLATTST